MNRPRGGVAHPKLLILGATLVCLLGLLVFAIDRGATGTPPTTTVKPVAQPPRPALTAAEKQYIRELWPIHGDVERSAMRMALGQIFYKTQDLGRTELGTRVEQALASYRSAEKRLRALEPPASLRSDHEQYLATIRLFEKSAIELQKMFKNRQDDHILVAYPKSQEKSNKIREVGGK